jgi:hypothetical protein
MMLQGVTTMKLSFSPAELVADGIWIVKVDPSDLRPFSARAARSSGRSILVVSQPIFDEVVCSLQVPLRGVEVVLLGQGADAVVVDRDGTEPSETIVAPAELQSNSDQKGVLSAPTSSNQSTQEFLRESAREELPGPLIALMGRLLDEVENKLAFPFSLHQGKARKWTAEPNFLAISIQNRNKKYLISVRGDYRTLPRKTISPVRGRGISYSEFHFESDDQFEEALRVILSSAQI